MACADVGETPKGVHTLLVTRAHGLVAAVCNTTPDHIRVSHATRPSVFLGQTTRPLFAQGLPHLCQAKPARVGGVSCKTATCLCGRRSLGHCCVCMECCDLVCQGSFDQPAIRSCRDVRSYALASKQPICLVDVAQAVVTNVGPHMAPYKCWPGGRAAVEG